MLPDMTTIPVHMGDLVSLHGKNRLVKEYCETHSIRNTYSFAPEDIFSCNGVNLENELSDAMELFPEYGEDLIPGSLDYADN
jgi:hypothetical protein